MQYRAIVIHICHKVKIADTNIRIESILHHTRNSQAK